MSRAVLGIDLGTSCGWALLRPDGTRVASGTWDLRVSKHEGQGMRPLRLRRLLGEMLDTVPAYSPGLVAYELVRRHLGTSAAHVYGELRGVLFAECDLRGVPYAAVEVSAAKREATGRGNAGKEAMTEAARARWPEALLGTDDEADALWIAAAALRELPASDRAG